LSTIWSENINMTLPIAVANSKSANKTIE
jgi:hypothetical protein